MESEIGLKSGELYGRRGKIARLPEPVRDGLNRRLRDGATGEELLTWLNGLPEVREVLDARFGGDPINKQNLSSWRRGGFQQWHREERAMQWMNALHHLDGEEGEMVDRRRVGALVSTRLVYELATRHEAALAGCETPQEALEEVHRSIRSLSTLRRHDHRAKDLDLKETSLRLNQDRLAWKQETERRRAERGRAARRKGACRDGSAAGPVGGMAHGSQAEGQGRSSGADETGAGGIGPDAVPMPRPRCGRAGVRDGKALGVGALSAAGVGVPLAAGVAAGVARMEAETRPGTEAGVPREVGSAPASGRAPSAQPVKSVPGFLFGKLPTAGLVKVAGRERTDRAAAGVALSVGVPSSAPAGGQSGARSESPADQAEPAKPVRDANARTAAVDPAKGPARGPGPQGDPAPSGAKPTPAPVALSQGWSRYNAVDGKVVGDALNAAGTGAPGPRFPARFVKMLSKSARYDACVIGVTEIESSVSPVSVLTGMSDSIRTLLRKAGRGAGQESREGGE